MAVPYTFGSATAAIPLSQLDSNFASTITLGNTAIQLGNTVTILNNMTFANVTVSSGNVTVTTATATTANLVTINATTLNAATHRSDGSIVLQTNGTTTAVTIDSSQNVGVGVTPSAWSGARALDIGTRGSLVDWSSSQQTDIWSNGYFNGTNSIYKTTANASIYRQSVGQHIWYNAPSGTAGNAITFTQAMTLDASGNLLVGTTAVGGKLYVVSNLTSNNGCRIDTPASFTSTGILSLCGAAGSTSWNHVSGLGNGGSQTNFIIYGNGNMVNANNSYGAISDVKLKENITDTTPKLADLMQVKVRNYNLIGSTTKQLGFVAQELEAIFPSMIDESPDRDAKGNDLGTTTKSVKYSVFVPMLIKAIQEQQALITNLTERLVALEGK